MLRLTSLPPGEIPRTSRHKIEKTDTVMVSVFSMVSQYKAKLNFWKREFHHR